MTALNLSSHNYLHMYLVSEDIANVKEIYLEILADLHVFSSPECIRMVFGMHYVCMNGYI
jgi:hypothetical protein